MKRAILSAPLTLLATGAFAWWVKGDLEMVWLVWMLVVPLAGTVIGFVAALALRTPVLPAAVSAVLVGPVAGVLALWGAIATPHAWDSPDRARVEHQATSLAADVPRIETLVRELLGAGVDVLGARPAVRGGRVRKEPFRFVPRREPAVAEPAALDSARAAPWRINGDALRRRFDAHALHLGKSGASAWMPGTLLPLRLDRADDDWSLLVVRVGGPDGLEVVREVSRDESRAALARAAARAGREVRDVVVNFTPNHGGVTFEPAAGFDFIGIPVDRRANIRLVARLRDGEFSYDTMGWFDGW